MDRPVRLIVNPSAGAGRAARLLPDVEAALRSHGIVFRVDRTTRSSTRASWPARRATPARWRPRWAATAWPARWRASCRAPTRVMAVAARRAAATTSRASSGIGHDPVAAVDVLAAGSERRIDVAEAAGTVYLGILSAGFDSDVNEIANSTRLPLGTLVYAYGALRALWSWKPARWEVVVDG